MSPIAPFSEAGQGRELDLIEGINLELFDTARKYFVAGEVMQLYEVPDVPCFDWQACSFLIFHSS